MLSKDLEVTLNLAFRDARTKRHEYMTVEHLLLALIDERAAQGCDFDEEEALDAESDVRDMDCESFYEAVYVDARLVESVWTDCAEEGEE